jgi:protein-export SecD/SecF family membrane protein
MGSANVDQQIQDARNLELVLHSGALPAPISPSNEQAIEASLGQDAIAQGIKAAGVGASLVLVFMVLYYSRAGIIANIAVLFNAMLQIAILAMFDASMTLPGIAGLALTIGIAVDANVLINERIREELRQGKSARAAVDVGYEKAFSAILDGHATTLISGLILATYGTGPIKGFAVTLIVLPMLVAMFRNLDTDRSGSIDEKELAPSFPLIEKLLPKDQNAAAADSSLPAPWGLGDDNADGSLSVEELTNLLRRLDPGLARWAEQLFARLDKNRDGRLDASELGLAAKTAGTTALLR